MEPSLATLENIDECIRTGLAQDRDCLQSEMRAHGARLRGELRAIANREIKEYRDADSLIERFDAHPVGSTADLLPIALKEFFIALLGLEDWTQHEKRVTTETMQQK